ncbi:MAG: DNA polymerase Y family protein [Caulobacteraceae bacterium]|nr:DNA polymerase Y family protein [Caulobacteraceae bacterium]
MGLYPGQKATDAVALVPELATADADPAGDLAALNALADWCVRFSPAVAPDPPDGLFLDITGAAHLWGGERAMLDDLLDRLAAAGVPARGAVAGSAGAAFALARFGMDRTVAETGEEAAVTAFLPTAALRLGPEDAAQLARLGLSRIGQLVALPRDQLARRFGAQTLLRLDQALGRAPEALAFRRPPTPWFARLAFAEPISAPEDLGRVAGDITALLCRRLEAEGRGAGRFELAFHRLDGRSERLSVGLSLPGRRSAPIVRLFAPLLEKVDPGFGIEAATLVAERVEPLAERQTSLETLGEIAPEDGIGPLIDRIANRLGEARVWRAEPFASHIPERAVVRRPPFAPRAAGDWDRGRPRPVRLLRRPEPIEAAAPIPDDPPIFFRWRGQLRRVRRAEGPERLAEEWWRQPPGQTSPSEVRDYYRVEDETGARYWIFRAGLYGGAAPPKWWLHGLFG